MASPKSRNAILKEHTNSFGERRSRSPSASKRWLSTPNRKHIPSPSLQSDSPVAMTAMASPPRARPPRPARSQRDPRLVSHGIPVTQQPEIPALSVRRATWVDSNGKFQQCSITEYTETKHFIKLLLLVGPSIQDSQAAVISRWSPVLERTVECPIALPRVDGESVEKTVTKLLGDIKGSDVLTSRISPEDPSGDAIFCGAFSDLAIVHVATVDCLPLVEGTRLMDIRELQSSELVLDSHLSALLQGSMLAMNSDPNETEEEPEEQHVESVELAEPATSTQWQPSQQKLHTSIIKEATYTPNHAPNAIPLLSALGLGAVLCIVGGLVGFNLAKRKH